MGKSNKTQFLTLALILLLMTFSINAEIPTYISYQGRLLDSNGDPMADVEHDIVLKIYEDDVTPTALWSSGILTGTPTDGLFSIHLGPIPSSVFTAGSQRYLGITIDSDPEMTPRTEITSIPYAYKAQVADTAEYARRIDGDIVTDDGILLINTLDRDSAFLFDAGINSSFKMFNPQPEPPVVLFEMNASSATGATFNIFDEIGQVMGFEPTPFNEGYGMKLIDPGDDGKLLEIVGNHMTNEAGIYLIDPGDDGHTISLTSAMNAGSFKMFNPQPEPPAVLFEMNASTETGATFNIYDEIGQVMGFEPSPFNEGYGMKLIDPGDDGKLLEIVGNHMTNEAGIYLIDPGDDGHTVEMISASNSGSIKMFNPQPEPPALLFDLTASSTNGATLSIYDEIGQVLGFEPMPFNPGYSIKLIDPGDDGKLVEISSAYEAGQGSGKVSVFDDFLMLESHFGPGSLTLKYRNGETEGPPIFMHASNTNAQIGIGTNSPTEALHVLGNIYATGTITELSDASVKSNIETIDDALELVDNLRGVRYNLDSELADELKATDDKQIGLIAQEVEMVLPEVVNSPDEGYKSIDYSRLTAVLIEAVKELKVENEKLLKRVEKLEKK